MKGIKKCVAWVIALVMITRSMTLPVYAEDSQESKTAITTAEELMAISEDMSGNYYLANDIELTETFTPLGLGDTEDVPFTGTFDGQGHKITGFQYVNDDAGNVGLFAINEGTICNLTIAGNVEAYTCAGIVAGVNSGLIENVHVTGSYVYGYEDTSSVSNLYASGNYIGGIAGKNKSTGIIRYCSVENSNVNGVRWAGGLAGANAGHIEQSWVTGTGMNMTMTMETLAQNAAIVMMNTNKFVYSKLGMFTGENTGTGSIENCFVYDCNMKAWDYTGGLVGSLVNPGTVKNSYAAEVKISYYSPYSYGNYTYTPNNIDLTIGEYFYENQISGVYYNYGAQNIGSGNGYTIAGGALKQQSTFTEFDFDTIWSIDAAKNGGYPYLQVSEKTPDVPEPEPETYTVTYVYNNEVKATDEVTKGETVAVRGEEICYDGAYDNVEYVKVTGWTDGNNTYAIGAEITPESDMTLTACTVPVTELCDGDTEDVIGYITPEDDLTKVAYGLSYDSGSPMDIVEVKESYVIDGIWKTVSVQNLDEPDAADIRYIFAGWFKTARTDSENYKNADWDDENSVDPATLFEGENRPKRIYAYWMLGNYQKTTMGYVSTGKVASRLYTISTVPYDLFRNYGFILSTNVPAGTKDAPEEMVIGGTIGGKAVGKIEKTSIYTSFRDSKVYTSAHRANQFNGGYAGYISYGSVSNLSLTYADKTPVTVSARAYYTTKDGTLVYCDLSQTTLQANTVDKGLDW